MPAVQVWQGCVGRRTGAPVPANVRPDQRSVRHRALTFYGWSAAWLLIARGLISFSGHSCARLFNSVSGEDQNKTRSLDMSDKMLSRRGAITLLGLAALGFAVPTTVLTTSDAEAQPQPSPAAPAPSGPAPSGMIRGEQRRAARRSARQTRREARRTARETRRRGRRNARRTRRQGRRGVTPTKQQ